MLLITPSSLLSQLKLSTSLAALIIRAGDSGVLVKNGQKIDTSELSDNEGGEVDVGDVTVTDVGGDTQLGFPSGETVVLADTDVSDVNTHEQLHSLGIPYPGARLSFLSVEALKERDDPGLLMVTSLSLEILTAR